jgi:hypothetical protein
MAAIITGSGDARFPPPCKRGRGTALREQRGGGGAGRDETLATKVKRRVRSPPTILRLRYGWSPSPAIAGEDEHHRSRGALRARVLIKPVQASSLQNPIFVRSIRWWFPASSRSESKPRSPDEAKRNPGTIDKLQCRSRISLRSIRATKKEIKEAERRKALVPYLRTLRCGSRPAGRARLPAFHRGSCQRDSCIPTAQLRARLRGTSTRRWRGYPARRRTRLQRAPRVPVIVPAG